MPSAGAYRYFSQHGSTLLLSAHCLVTSLFAQPAPDCMPLLQSAIFPPPPNAPALEKRRAQRGWARIDRYLRCRVSAAACGSALWIHQNNFQQHIDGTELPTYEVRGLVFPGKCHKSGWSSTVQASSEVLKVK